MSVTEGNAPLKGSFELDRAPLSIGKVVRFNSKQPLECIPLCDDSSYMREFDVITYIVDYVEYMCCVLFILLSFHRALQITTLSIRHFNAKIFCNLPTIKLKPNIIMIPHIFRENVM